MREHEYMHWLEQRVVENSARRDDAVRDESYAAFMAERGAEQEKRRLQGVAEERREQRWRKRGRDVTTSAFFNACDPRVVMQRTWKAFCEDNGWPNAVDDMDLRRGFVALQRKESERQRQQKRTEARRHAKRKLGRVDEGVAGPRTCALTSSGARGWRNGTTGRLPTQGLLLRLVSTSGLQRRGSRQCHDRCVRKGEMYCAHHIPQPESAASAGVLVVSMPESELSQSALPASPRVTVYSLGSDDESVTFSMALGDIVRPIGAA